MELESNPNKGMYIEYVDRKMKDVRMEHHTGVKAKVRKALTSTAWRFVMGALPVTLAFVYEWRIMILWLVFALATPTETESHDD